MSKQCYVSWQVSLQSGMSDYFSALLNPVETGSLVVSRPLSDRTYWLLQAQYCKRSHKYSKSGMAIIIGKETRKLLYLGVRNKYCHACARQIPKEHHKCFLNWTASSSEMETDIILEGFLEAERVHGVRYIQFIGDGDSSVHPTLIQNTFIPTADFKLTPVGVSTIVHCESDATSDVGFPFAGTSYTPSWTLATWSNLYVPRLL